MSPVGGGGGGKLHQLRTTALFLIMSRQPNSQDVWRRVSNFKDIKTNRKSNLEETEETRRKLQTTIDILRNIS